MNKNNTEQNDIALTPAERYYKKQLLRCAKYQKSHKEKVNELSRKSYQKMSEDDDRLKAFKEKKKQYYQDVVKPKLLALKNIPV